MAHTHTFNSTNCYPQLEEFFFFPEPQRNNFDNIQKILKNFESIETGFPTPKYEEAAYSKKKSAYFFENFL